MSDADAAEYGVSLEVNTPIILRPFLTNVETAIGVNMTHFL